MQTVDLRKSQLWSAQNVWMNDFECARRSSLVGKCRTNQLLIEMVIYMWTMISAIGEHKGVGDDKSTVFCAITLASQSPSEFSVSRSECSNASFPHLPFRRLECGAHGKSTPAFIARSITERSLLCAFRNARSNNISVFVVSFNSTSCSFSAQNYVPCKANAISAAERFRCATTFG